jgi:hypothetical protein
MPPGYRLGEVAGPVLRNQVRGREQGHQFLHRADGKPPSPAWALIVTGYGSEKPHRLERVQARGFVATLDVPAEFVVDLTDFIQRTGKSQ